MTNTHSKINKDNKVWKKGSANAKSIIGNPPSGISGAIIYADEVIGFLKWAKDARGKKREELLATALKSYKLLGKIINDL